VLFHNSDQLVQVGVPSIAMETNNSNSAWRVGSSVKIQLYAVFRAYALREFGLHRNDAQYVAFRIIVNDYAGWMLHGFIGGQP
jgi:hypothetical protein